MTEASDVLPPGTRLEEFEIERYLNAGGFGVTYLARDLSLDARRVVKEYLPREWATRRQDWTVGPRTDGNENYAWGLKHFLAEARMLARFRDPRIVHVYRVIEAWGTAYMVMEHVEGRTLRAEVEATGLLSESRVRDLLDGLLAGLSVVHEAKMWHRDIKPENVMVRPDGTPVLIDFGSARYALGTHSQSLNVALTPRYAPFEQHQNRNQGPWTDIYSLGAVAYWALSGEEPDVATVRVEEDNLRPLSSVVPGRVSDELSSAVDAALHVFGRDRPQSLEEWRALLDGGAGPVKRGSSRSAGVGVEGMGTTGGSSGPLRRWWPAAAALAAVVLAVALVPRWYDTVSEERRAPAQPASADVLPGPRPQDAVAPEPSEGEEPITSGAGFREVPAESPAKLEAALGLDRAQRRVIQEGLIASGFNPGVADGAFGEGTRSALREWQSSRGLRATGHLDATTSAVLRGAGEEAARVEAQRQAEREAEAEHRRPGRVFRDCDVCPEMVVMAGGDLSLGRYEVTVGEYRAFEEATGGGVTRGCQGSYLSSWSRATYPQTDRHPVICVNWDDAKAYALWLSQTTGAVYRLPTEMEWLEAAGDFQVGCYEEVAGRPGTCPVGSYGANPTGLFDMGGNVTEWLEDCYRGDCSRHTARGTAWHWKPDGHGRTNPPATVRTSYSGFRVARAL